MTTSSTVTLNIHRPPKPKGWCEDRGLVHAWEAGPTLTVPPPIPTRECLNCGQRQYFRPGQWEDAP